MSRAVPAFVAFLPLRFCAAVVVLPPYVAHWLVGGEVTHGNVLVERVREQADLFCVVFVWGRAGPRVGWLLLVGSFSCCYSSSFCCCAVRDGRGCAGGPAELLSGPAAYSSSRMSRAP